MDSKQDNIDISVVVPVYNHEKYIEKALTSILEQHTTYRMEILIGEDCSPDHSRNILKRMDERYPGRMQIFYHEKNIGATKNVYLLCKASKGKYIAILEGDDYWIDKYKIQKQITFLEKHQEYIGAACNFLKIDSEEKILENQCISNGRVNRDFTWEDFLKYGFEFQTGTLMFRNFLLDGNDYSILYKAHEMVGDLTILTILLNRGTIYVMNDIMSAYRFIVSPDAVNATSIAKKDPALSRIKTVKQYTMLKPFLTKKGDFDYRISELKIHFVIQMLKHKEGYTWKRWKILYPMGGRRTNLLMVSVLIRKGRERLAKCNCYCF